MITYNIVLLTDLESVNEADCIQVQYGTEVLDLCGVTVKAFVAATNKSYVLYPGHDCLSCGLEFVPPKLRPVFTYLYEVLKEIIV